MLAAYTSKVRLVLAILTCCSFLFVEASFAQNATPTPSPQAQANAGSSLEDRVASLEAYIKNTDGTKTLADSPGPGHNAWMMTSAALVLFMTLPGLALFYGGLVRKKNVLSVLAQCLGIAGLVTLLWWSFGYSLVFGKGFNNGFFGGAEHFFLNGVTSSPILTTAFGFRRTYTPCIS
jgi:Amt family ammonium transporter